MAVNKSQMRAVDVLDIEAQDLWLEADRIAAQIAAPELRAKSPDAVERLIAAEVAHRQASIAVRSLADARPDEGGTAANAANQVVSIRYEAWSDTVSLGTDTRRGRDVELRLTRAQVQRIAALMGLDKKQEEQE